MSDLTLFDAFSGGGGASVGATRVPGVKLTFAANHWPTAVQTHAANHPDAEHAVADLSQLDPRAIPHTDLAWLSPSCTHHTQAQGRLRDDEAAKRSRATMWCAVNFAEHHRYEAVFVENVLEVMRWELWRTWRQAMETLGYHLHVVSLNAALVGDGVPQWRDRLFVVATRARLDLSSHLLVAEVRCDHCGGGARPAIRLGTVGRFGRQYRLACAECFNDAEPAYVPGAVEIVDHRDRGVVVGDRFRSRTRDKIGLGIERFGGRPFVAELRGGGSTVRSMGDPLSTVTASGTHHLLVWPDGPRVEDATARMASVGELAAAQGFPPDYVWHGTKTDVVRQIGNAVATNVAEHVVSTTVAGLEAAA